MKTLRTIAACLAVLIAMTASTILVPTVSRAEACPFVLTKMCVQEKGGYKHWAWTNKCLAKQEGLKVLPDKACKGMW